MRPSPSWEGMDCEDLASLEGSVASMPQTWLGKRKKSVPNEGREDSSDREDKKRSVKRVSKSNRTRCIVSEEDVPPRRVTRASQRGVNHRRQLSKAAQNSLLVLIRHPRRRIVRLRCQTRSTALNSLRGMWSRENSSLRARKKRRWVSQKLRSCSGPFLTNWKNWRQHPQLRL